MLTTVCHGQVPHWRVLVIEAGGNEPTGTQVPSMFLNFLGTSIDWAYRTEPEDMACLAENERRCYWPRGKVSNLLHTCLLISQNNTFSALLKIKKVAPVYSTTKPLKVHHRVDM